MFYVYLYLDPRKAGPFEYQNHVFDFEPFYVGKGSNNRLNEHRQRIDHSPMACKLRKLQSLGIEPVILKYKLFEDEIKAFDFEIQLIAEIGRKDLGHGPLCNLTNGGEGSSGYIFTPEQKQLQSERMTKWSNENPVTSETRMKLSIAGKGRIITEETRHRMSLAQTGCKHTLATIERMGIAAKKRGTFYKTCHCGVKIDVGNYAKYHGDNCGKTGLWPISEEQKIKISRANKGRILPKHECLYCHKLVDGGNYARWHGDNCKEK